ncbi:alpha/beta fold hydrolase [Metabacillus arenae]|uniref:Alpha/beta hydrolase n=1 Tax=Metabacillus arenae TaxID=2771434 RepID=A0A926N8G1_9BACI|nr:alpha/beta hydrolase [Metabacillus arenae]MBD1379387.1 alpha/beta hydrolase [Metabacillus arenae]
MKTSIYKSEEGKRKIAEHYENYIKTFTCDFERLYVRTSFGKTHVLVAGPSKGKPLFLLQGGNCINPMTLSWFSPLIEEYRIYAPDTIGHPGYSDQNRLSAKDNSFALWITELMNYFNLERCAFIGPSYGAGIILRLAVFMPNKIDCSILVSPAGIQLGSKLEMIKNILLPLILFNTFSSSSEKYLTKMTSIMSANSMKEIDKLVIGDIFKYLKLEQEMPKLTEKEELMRYNSPTLIIAGEKDIFFPANRLNVAARKVISNLTAFKTITMGHFPSEENLVEINNEIKEFLNTYY